MEGRRKLKIGKKEAHMTRVKDKVSKPINVETENAPYLPKGRSTNFKRGTLMEYDDPHHRHAR